MVLVGRDCMAEYQPLRKLSVAAQVHQAVLVLLVCLVFHLLLVVLAFRDVQVCNNYHRLQFAFLFCWLQQLQKLSVVSWLLQT